jgi:hypothetical protein
VSTVDHPKHYNSHPSGVEAIDICEVLGFNLGNAIKYLFRADYKGTKLEDLKKAAWYLKRYAEGGVRWGVAHPKLHDVLRFEPHGAVLGDVLRILANHNGPHAALVRVEKEVSVEERKIDGGTR